MRQGLHANKRRRPIFQVVFGDTKVCNPILKHGSNTKHGLFEIEIAIRRYTNARTKKSAQEKLIKSMFSNMLEQVTFGILITTIRNTLGR